MFSRMSVVRAIGLASSVIGASLVPAVASAQPAYEVLHSFVENLGRPNKLLEMPDGKVYGTTSQGGAGRGSVFVLTPNGSGGYIHSTLHEFNLTDGAHPYAGLTLGPDGNLYGVTTQGGAFSGGTAFRITPGGTFTLIHSFGSSSGPRYAWGELLLADDGNFYGTSVNGGPSGYGTVFKLTPAGVVTMLFSFNYSGTGAYPYAGLMQAAAGLLYGVAYYGGPGGCGTIFSISKTGSTTILNYFNCGSNGQYPFGKLVQGGDGALYGTTNSGGAFGGGVVFRSTLSGGLSVLHSFNYSQGGNPWAGLLKSTDGNFYGTTLSGGSSGNGTVFKLSPSGTHTLLHSFSSTGGYYPRAALIQSAAGTLIGSTEQGATNRGTVYEISTSGSLTVLHQFVDDRPGCTPTAVSSAPLMATSMARPIREVQAIGAPCTR